MSSKYFEFYKSAGIEKNGGLMWNKNAGFASEYVHIGKQKKKCAMFWVNTEWSEARRDNGFRCQLLPFAIQPDVNTSPTSHQTVTSSLRNYPLLCLKYKALLSSINPLCPIPTVLRTVCSWSAPLLCRICRSIGFFILFSFCYVQYQFHASKNTLFSSHIWYNLFYIRK